MLHSWQVRQVKIRNEVPQSAMVDECRPLQELKSESRATADDRRGFDKLCSSAAAKLRLPYVASRSASSGLKHGAAGFAEQSNLESVPQ